VRSRVCGHVSGYACAVVCARRCLTTT
jgi:hypothetical protein